MTAAVDTYPGGWVECENCGLGWPPDDMHGGWCGPCDFASLPEHPGGGPVAMAVIGTCVACGHPSWIELCERCDPFVGRWLT